MLNQLSLQATYGQYLSTGDPARVALRMYNGARARAWAARLRSAVTRRSRRLLQLSAAVPHGTVRGSRYAGFREVPIDQIRGSEGRPEGFDIDMLPTDGQSRGRWVSVAAARQRGVQLPPVELIQVGGVYFVRDGHHRISVARALGEQFIDAEVTVWKVDDPQPAKAVPSSSRLVPQLA